MSKMETGGFSDCPKLYGDAARVRGEKECFCTASIRETVVILQSDGTE